MKAVIQAIRLLVVIQVISNVLCQDGFGERDILRLQQIPSNDGQVETITSYSTNIIQRDPNSQSISSVSVQYHMTDPEKNEEYSRAGRGRKIYRIKNPFDHQNQEDDIQETNTAETQDSGTGASNQYSAMQYSLPPEEFLQQMRAENQFYQQQASTPSPHLGYTATPQPQYQYSTISPNYNDNNHQSNQIPQLEPKTSVDHNYLTNTNQHQYGNVYNFDGAQSTPASVTPHLSTVLPNNQYVGTQPSSYISSSSPIYISSPPNLQHYVSSPLSSIQDVSPDYSNRVSSTAGSNSINYENEFQKKMLIDHYDNSAHGVRYPVNVQQYLNDYPSSTISPSSSPYSDQGHDSWLNQQNRANSVSKSLQELSLTQYQNYPFNNNNNQQDMRSDSHIDSSSGDNHRLGNVPAANTLYLNYAQPEFQSENNRGRTRNFEDSVQNNYYSHGDYGWKLQNKKALVSTENYPQGSYSRYQFPNNQPMALQSTPGVAVSQMNFHMDTGRPQTYDQVSKSGADTLDAQDFARAAAKAQERQQQQQHQQQIYGNNYQQNYNLPSSNPGPSYGNNDKQRNRYNENINPYNNFQTDLVTASPYYYVNSKDNSVDNKPKLPFDHDKALKNIVPIDVSNVVGSSESPIRGIGGQDNNRYNLQNFGKNQFEENLKQYYRSVTDAYYKDKNSIYGFNIKSRPEDILNSENKQLDSNIPIYAKQQQIQEAIFNQGNLQDKRYFEGSGSSPTYVSSPSSNYQDSIQSSANIQQQGLQRPQNAMPNDIANILKLNDVPYRFNAGLTEGDTLRLHNNNNFDTIIPTSLPNRINQNVGSHQLDVAILNKLLNKQAPLNLNRPDIDPQASGLISNINGFKVANPFNVDLKLVADMLKGKPAIDDTHLLPLSNQFGKTIPLKLDLSHLQQLLLKNENSGSYVPLNDGLSSFSNPYVDFYGAGRPYQGVKYSRSQEEEENETIIPIADASNNHPIGAVIEQLDDITNEREANTGPDVIEQDEEAVPSNYKKRPKHYIPRHRIGDKHRHPNSLPDQRTYQRRYPKLHSAEPYPLLKPPSPQNSRDGRNNFDKNSKRRRVKPKMLRILKTEPLYEAGTNIDEEEATVPTLLRPPPPIADAKMDNVSGEESTLEM